MKSENQQYSTYISVPAEDGARVDKSITINRPVDDVYSFLHRLENLPRFMWHLDAVEPLDEHHSRWKLKTLDGRIIQWESETIEERENEMISWRSTPGGDLNNAGSIWLTPASDGKDTVLRFEMKYVSPDGKNEAFLADLFGHDADVEIAEDLMRLKRLLETRTLPESKRPVLKRIKRATRAALRATDTTVHGHAWKAIGSAALGAFALGMLFGRRQQWQTRSRIGRWGKFSLLAAARPKRWRLISSRAVGMTGGC